MKKKIIALAVAAMAVLSAQAQNMIDGHEYVDLGLPSGTLWATMNVGADFHRPDRKHRRHVDA